MSGTSLTVYRGGSGEFGADVPDDCPPKAAIRGPKLLFRLVRHNPLAAADFRTTKEEGKFKTKDACQRCSISMQETEHGARALRDVIPNLAGRKIAKGIVPAEAGKLMSTPSNNNPEHWSWWPASTCARQSYFEIVDEIS
jgi:hypothetical protein